jgi:hypothetical protein
MDVYSGLAHRNFVFLIIKPWAYFNSIFVCKVQIKIFIVLVRKPCRVLCSSRRCGVTRSFGIDGEVQTNVDTGGSCRNGGQGKGVKDRPQKRTIPTEMGNRLNSLSCGNQGYPFNVHTWLRESRVLCSH